MSDVNPSEENPAREDEFSTSATAPSAPPAPVFTPQIVTAPVVDELDELDATLESLGAARSEYHLEAHRLTNYERDQRTDAAAKKKYCSLVEVSSQVQEELRQRHGGGYYLLFLKQKGKIKKTYFVAIDGEPARAVTTATATAATTATAAPPSPLDAFNQLLPVFAMMKEMQTLFTPQAPAAQPSEITTEAAMMKLISADPTALASFRDRLLGPAQPEGRSAIVDLLSPIVQGVGPQLAQILLANALSNNRNQPAPPVQPHAQPGAAHAPAAFPQGQQTRNVVLPFPAAPAQAAPIAPESSGAPAPEQSADDDDEFVDMPHLDLIDGLVSMMVADLPVSAGVRLVNDFCAGFPDYVPQVRQILSQHPDQVLALLPLIDAKHHAAAQHDGAAAWLADLQHVLAQETPAPNSGGDFNETQT
jgi:hypothetical protein